MRSVWVQATLLTIYLVLFFVLCRLLDLGIWYQHGFPSTQIVDPLLLSARQMKQLLEHRGVNYAGYLEKKDLVQLVEASADVVPIQVEELSQFRGGLKTDRSNGELLSTPPPSTRFKGGPHFYEAMEDTKDSAWLVQIVQHKNELLDADSWGTVHSQVAPFAIRTGVLNCMHDRWLCRSKGWDKPMLLLALQKWTREEDRVEFETSTSTRPRAIVEWVQDRLSVHVKKIRHIELARHWLHSEGVKVLLLTHLTNPPLFLSALSIKFTGRIKFGMFSIKKEDSDEVRKELEMPDLRIPSYIIITPERTVVYGRRRSERFTFASMNFFLRTLHPETTDVFLCSLLLVNMLVVLQICQVSLRLSWEHAVQYLWTAVSYYFWLFLVWLLISGISNFSFVRFLAEKVARYLSLTEIGSLLRADLQVLTEHPYLLFFTFIVYGFMTTWLVGRTITMRR